MLTLPRSIALMVFWSRRYMRVPTILAAAHGVERVAVDELDVQLSRPLGRHDRPGLLVLVGYVV